MLDGIWRKTEMNGQDRHKERWVSLVFSWRQRKWLLAAKFESSPRRYSFSWYLAWKWEKEWGKGMRMRCLHETNAERLFEECEISHSYFFRQRQTLKRQDHNGPIEHYKYGRPKNTFLQGKSKQSFFHLRQTFVWDMLTSGFWWA